MVADQRLPIHTLQLLFAIQNLGYLAVLYWLTLTGAIRHKMNSRKVALLGAGLSPFFKVIGL
jgi:hypothetical protein